MAWLMLSMLGAVRFPGAESLLGCLSVIAFEINSPSPARTQVLLFLSRFSWSQTKSGIPSLVGIFYSSEMAAT